MLTRQEAARRQIAAKKKYEHARQAREKAERLKAKRTPAARALVPAVTLAEVLEAGLTVTTRQFRSLWWMDTSGKLHRDDTRSAEQLIEEEGKNK
jgi:hypothetical protein